MPSGEEGRRTYTVELGRTLNLGLLKQDEQDLINGTLAIALQRAARADGEPWQRSIVIRSKQFDFSLRYHDDGRAPDVVVRAKRSNSPVALLVRQALSDRVARESGVIAAIPLRYEPKGNQA